MAGRQAAPEIAVIGTMRLPAADVRRQYPQRRLPLRGQGPESVLLCLDSLIRVHWAQILIP
jgi:hypothetical protein